MFKESLLESSNVARKDKRWPMTLAFVLELITVSFLLIVPLMSTGVIPVMAHVPLIAPVHSVEVVDHPPSDASGRKGAIAGPSPVIRVFNNKRDILRFGHPQPIGDSEINPLEPIGDENGEPRVGDLMCTHDCITIARPPEPPTRVRFSHLSEALLVHKVDPVYPRPAILTHTFGAVKLHAIIAKDGTIQSLSVTSGNPLLVQAALDAVRQWRYKPYILNDVPVEVETFITVNFRPANN